eukprot:3026359-Prymnesium_polylepis.2
MQRSNASSIAGQRHHRAAMATGHSTPARPPGHQADDPSLASDCRRSSANSASVLELRVVRQPSRLLPVVSHSSADVRDVSTKPLSACRPCFSASLRSEILRSPQAESIASSISTLSSTLASSSSMITGTAGST